MLYTLLEGIRFASLLLEPVIPSKALEIRSQLGLTAIDATGVHGTTDGVNALTWGVTPSGIKINPSGILFPKIEVEKSDVGALLDPKDAPNGLGSHGNAPAQPIQTKKEKQPVSEIIEQPITSSDFINIDDFMKVDLRIAEVLTCEKLEKSDKLLKFTLELRIRLARGLAGANALPQFVCYSSGYSVVKR